MKFIIFTVKPRNDAGFLFEVVCATISVICSYIGWGSMIYLGVRVFCAAIVDSGI